MTTMTPAPPTKIRATPTTSAPNAAADEVAPAAVSSPAASLKRERVELEAERDVVVQDAANPGRDAAWPTSTSPS